MYSPKRPHFGSDFEVNVTVLSGKMAQRSANGHCAELSADGCLRKSGTQHLPQWPQMSIETILTGTRSSHAVFDLKKSHGRQIPGAL